MGIYRGPGGSGDATNDASSETRLAVEARDAAIAAQLAAEAAQAAAETAEINAETAETNAETAETNAETAASAASTSASNASTSATNAASSASSASTSATNAASSASAASSSASSASTSATNAASSASSASTSATNASNSATAAASSASSASTSATNAASSASAASTSATAAQTAETNAETAEANAETAQAAAELAETNAETAATNAASSASSASTSASNASTSATNAANSASAAATSATNASNSATAAANSASTSQTAADAALAALDSFDDRYLGQKSTAPTVDNDGNALVTGALYFDTVSNAMKVWDGTQWLSAYASLSGALLATNNLSDLTSTSTARTNLGLGTAATTNSTAYATAAQGTTADTAYADRMKWDGGSTGLVAATGRTSLGVTATGSDTTYAYRANNLSDLASASTARTNLGLGTAATTAATDYATAAQGTKADTAYGWGNHASAGYLTTSVAASTYQPLDSDLTAFAAKTAPTGDVVGTSDSQTLTNKTLTSPTISSPSISSGNLTFSTTGQRITGDFSNATAASRVMFQSSTTNGVTSVAAIPNGTSTSAFIAAYNSSAGNDCPATVIRATSAENSLLATGVGTFSYLPMTFYTGGSERMRVDTSGNFGIGTSSPSYKLTIADSTNDAQAGIVALSANRAAILNLTGTIAGYNWIKSNTSGTADWQIGGGAATGTLTFATGSSNTERMRIDASGNVGIGTTAGTTTVSSGIAINNSTAGNYPGLEIQTAGVTRMYLNANNAASYITSVGTNPLVTYTNGSERMRIDSSGNVGIGTAAIYQQLMLKRNTSIGWVNAAGNGSDQIIYANSSSGLEIYTNNTQRVTIDSNGNALFSNAVRATITTDNDLSFDMNAASNFKCTPSAGGALTFTNITSGQTGNILLVNGSNYAITAAATTKVSATCLATISATGTYWLSYYSDGTNVYVANTGALA